MKLNICFVALIESLKTIDQLAASLMLCSEGCHPFGLAVAETFVDDDVFVRYLSCFIT